MTDGDGNFAAKIAATLIISSDRSSLRYSVLVVVHNSQQIYNVTFSILLLHQGDKSSASNDGAVAAAFAQQGVVMLALLSVAAGSGGLRVGCLGCLGAWWVEGGRVNSEKSRNLLIDVWVILMCKY